MFSGLKEKLLNASIFTNSEVKTGEPEHTLNFNAGASILHHFQKNWEELHKNNEDNAKEAEKVADTIETLSNKIHKDKENLLLITHIFTNSNLTSNITGCLNSIKELYATAESVEKDLVVLENIIEEIEFENMKLQHRQHLKNYEERKEESLAKFKAHLEEKHFKKIAEYESSKKALMEERQKVFQNAFKTDLELYKNSGTVPINERLKQQNGALLEEIQIDFDQKELDQFFNDVG